MGNKHKPYLFGTGQTFKDSQEKRKTKARTISRAPGSAASEEGWTVCALETGSRPYPSLTNPGLSSSACDGSTVTAQPHYHVCPINLFPPGPTCPQSANILREAYSCLPVPRGAQGHTACPGGVLSCSTYPTSQPHA